jgi:hypothetical protein
MEERERAAPRPLRTPLNPNTEETKKMKVQTSITYTDNLTKVERVCVYTHSDVKIARAWVKGMIADGYKAEFLGKVK